MLRREFIASLAALAATPVLAEDAELTGLKLAEGTPFSSDDVVSIARSLSESAYSPPTRIPDAWTNIDYEDYVSIWFDPRNALWSDEPDIPVQLDVFSPGLYFPTPIGLSVVEDGTARPVEFDINLFAKTDQFPDLPIDETLGYSGLRLRAELEEAGVFTEFSVFQGASYFRGIGTGEIYGLSARGLAIDTVEPSGEEFPEFRAFWLEKPAPGADTFVLHALLDSPSCAGAYRFEITPGVALTMNITARIFPRVDMNHVGIGPLTSMFQYDQTNRDKFSDFRPAVHDSDGLLIINGGGETLWRPLANPTNLQVSGFLDNNPRGFGLMQRAQTFGDFADLEALYHKRPSVWVEPQGDWGRGNVTLVEIPTPSEVFDNIVCYWRPSGGLPAGSDTEFSYRLTWSQETNYGEGLTVQNTAIGAGFDGDGLIVAIDFAPGIELPEDFSTISHPIRASSGTVSNGVLQKNPETGGPRLAFKFEPQGAELIEFRTQLFVNDDPISEVWLYRWTA